jgi:hypothetical protein
MISRSICFRLGFESLLLPHPVDNLVVVFSRRFSFGQLGVLTLPKCVLIFGAVAERMTA